MSRPLRLDRAFIRVSGAGARAFLHNLLTQDVEALDTQAPAYAGLLSPQGKVICDMLLWPQGEDVLIEADPAHAADLLRRLTMFRLRAPIGIAEQSNAFAALFYPERAAPGAFPDPRRPDGALGWRGLAASAEAAELEPGEGPLRRTRVAAGVPDMASDAAPEEVFALEALFEELHGVDFHKGCFVGQENVSRMKRRATTRKKFCPVAFEGNPPPYDTPILAGTAEIGRVRGGITGRALALLRLDRAREAQDQGVALTAADRPLRLDPPPWLILPHDKPGEV